MKRKVLVRIVVGAVGALAVAGGGAAYASSQGGGEADVSVAGPEAEKAAAAAVASTGGGKAGAVERDGEGGAVFDVEVTRPDGTVVDVRLDGSYQVLATAPDAEGAEGPETGKEVNEAVDTPPSAP